MPPPIFPDTPLGVLPALITNGSQLLLCTDGKTAVQSVLASPWICLNSEGLGPGSQWDLRSTDDSWSTNWLLNLFSHLKMGTTTASHLTGLLGSEPDSPPSPLPIFFGPSLLSCPRSAQATPAALPSLTLHRSLPGPWFPMSMSSLLGRLLAFLRCPHFGEGVPD